jgi:hypothetical protein
MRKFITDILAKANLGVEQNAYVLGYMGIGTISASQKLEVSGGDALIRNAFIGLIPSYGSNYASFSHTSRSAVNKYSFLSGNAGDTYVNSANGQPIYFRHENIDNATITADGKVGIGTTNPVEKLSLAGSTGTTFGLSLEPSGWNNAKHRFSVPISGDISMWSFNWNGTAVDSALYAPASILMAQGTITFNTIGSATTPSSRMIINSAGNVLIGTTTDNGSKLQVKGNARFNYSDDYGYFGLGYISGADYGIYNYNYGRTDLLIQQSTGNATFSSNVTAAGTITAAGSGGRTVVLQGGGSGSIQINGDGTSYAVGIAFNSQLGGTALSGIFNYGSGTTQNWLAIGGTSYNNAAMYVLPSGNIGIGTTSPSRKLSISDSYAYMDFKATSQRTYTIGSDAYGFIIYDDTASDYRLAINGSGNIGIGTLSPTQKLHVVGSQYTTGNITVGASGNYSNVNFVRADGAAVGGIGWRDDGIFYVGGHLGYGPNAGNNVRVYGFGANLSLGNNTAGDVLTVTNGGNVGIGTTSPSYKLHVVGEIYTNYRVQINDGTANLIIGHWDGVNARIENSGGRPLLITSYSQPINMSISGSGPAFSLKADSNAYFTGSLGIGTTSPAYKLDVNGTFRVTGSSILSQRVTGTEIGVTRDGSDSVADGPWFRWANAAENRQILTQLNASNGITTWAYNGSAWSSIYTLSSTGAATFSSSVTASGNIRINSVPTTTSALTTISSDWANGSTIYTSIRIGAAADSLLAGVELRTYSNYAASSGTDFAIWNNSTSNVLTERMRITSGGNVGINTTTPTETLDVNGAVNATGYKVNGAAGYNGTVTILQPIPNPPKTFTIVNGIITNVV